MIKLGEKEHPIRLSNGAFTIYEDITGKDPWEALSNIKELKRPRSIQALVYGGIKMGYLYREESCPLTFEEVGNLMDVRKLQEFLLVAMESLKVDGDVETEKKKTDI